ncbi:DUF418 domain-containing protein [Glycomyces tarimensis]
MFTTPAQTVAPPGPASLGPMSRGERSLAPDIARGGLLLFIAIANVAVHLSGHMIDDYTHFADSSTADRVALFLEQLFAAERSRPMFAILYGFGMAVMASRMFGRGMEAKGVRKVLRRRSWWLVLLGLLHAMFLFYGDILAPYGATGLIALFFVHLSTKALKRWLWGTGVYVVLVGTPVLAFMYSVGAGADTGLDMPAYAVQLVFGAIASVTGMLAFTVLMLFVPLVIVGMMIQRGGWIDHPERHLPQLRRVFVSGMVVNVASAMPVALVGLGAWHPPTVVFQGTLLLTLLGGMYAGLGYVCGFALLAHRWRARGRAGVPGALAAVGERSLTCYLAQSIIMAPLLAVWGLGLGDGMGYLTAYGVAAGTWLLTVLLAVFMAKRGWRGPFEVLLRRLTYGPERAA